MKLFFVFFAFALCVSANDVHKFPRCKLNDPHLSKCLIDGVEAVRPMLKAGMPEAGIPAIDPFVLSPYEIDTKYDNLKLKGTIQGKGSGGGAFKIDKLVLSKKDQYEIDLSLSIPTLHVTADYNMQQLNIINFDFEGKGKFSGKFTDVKAIVKINAKPTVKNGVEHLKLVDLSIKVKIDDGKISVQDEKSPILARTMASFFNVSPSIVLTIVSPVIDNICNDIVQDILNTAFDKIPLNEIVVSN